MKTSIKFLLTTALALGISASHLSAVEGANPNQVAVTKQILSEIIHGFFKTDADREPFGAFFFEVSEARRADYATLSQTSRPRLELDRANIKENDNGTLTDKVTGKRAICIKIAIREIAEDRAVAIVTTKIGTAGMDQYEYVLQRRSGGWRVISKKLGMSS
jgi:hypothetical protein